MLLVICKPARLAIKRMMEDEARQGRLGINPDDSTRDCKAAIRRIGKFIRAVERAQASTKRSKLVFKQAGA